MLEHELDVNTPGMAVELVTIDLTLVCGLTLAFCGRNGCLKKKMMMMVPYFWTAETTSIYIRHHGSVDGQIAVRAQRVCVADLCFL